MGTDSKYCNSLSCCSEYCKCEQERYNRALESKKQRDSLPHLMRRKSDHTAIIDHGVKQTHMSIENITAAASQDYPKNQEAQLRAAITPRAQILNEAMKITHHDRNANYGNPEDNFQNIANLWNAYLTVSRPMAAVLTPADVAVMSMLIKVARLGNNPVHHDSAVDIAGYAACLGDIQASMAKHQESHSGQVR